jgi:hypothetical protein
MKRSFYLWIAVLCLAGPLLAEPFKMTAAEVLDSPVRLSPLSATIHPEGGPLSVRFEMSNNSSEFISRVELTADVFSPDGQLKGFYSFAVNANLRPGEEKFFSQSTGTFALSPGDTVELAPETARLATGTWVRPVPDDKAEGGLKSLFENGGPADSCDARCAAKDESCTTKCVCGVLSFSCTCGVGTLSYTCSCQRCPT